MEARNLLAIDALGVDTDQIFTGSRFRDVFRAGSGTQLVDAGRGNDILLSYGDAGEPDPAQTDGEGRVNDPVPEGSADDILIGGPGADTFQFHPLINAQEEVLDQYRNQTSGRINWARVAGENDAVHEHWVEGVGNDTILDFSLRERDRIKIVGHTVAIRAIEYGEDEHGKFSLIILRSNQNGNGAHDDDHLGTIRVYGDKVTRNHLLVDAGKTYGMERLHEADRLAEDNGGGRRTVVSATDGDSFAGGGRVQDLVTLGAGSQKIDTQAGNDRYLLLGDGGEPDPAQTDGAEGRVNDPVPADESTDVVRGGLGRDKFEFRALINAKEEILEKHTRRDGRINWRRVAGENNNVHDHWVEGVGNDTILDYDQSDGDSIRILGHTLALAGIEYGEDARGAFSLIVLVSDQGGAGAHDGDSLGTIRVYGDKVTAADLTIKSNVFYGVDRLEEVAQHNNAKDRASGAFGSPSEGFEDPQADPESKQVFVGSRYSDLFRAGTGRQLVDAGHGRDVIVSYGDAGEPDPAQTDGAKGRVNDPIPAGLANDVFIGGSGADTFKFYPLINATDEVLDQYRNQTSGRINWARVAGENDAVHEHWVEGIGDDFIMDYSKSEGDRIKIVGHTVSVAAIEYGQDEGGAFSVIVLVSNQNGAGAHDGDSLGTITVYGDKVNRDDLYVNAGVTYGMERLHEADRLAEDNGGGRRTVVSDTDGDSFVGGSRVHDLVTLARGAQKVDTQAGNDRFLLLGDAGEPDPAQTDGAEGRVNEPVDPELANDVVRGGLGRDKFEFRALINAKDDILAKHTRRNGTINWRRVAGENNNVHDHWVEGIGDDTVLDYDKGDRDQIRIVGHTIKVADIEYGEDEGGRYSKIILVSDQGGAGAHDGDSLGSIKVYGDKVVRDDLVVKSKVFYGVDQLAWAARDDNSADRAAGLFGTPEIVDDGPSNESNGRALDRFRRGSQEGRQRFVRLAAAGRFDLPKRDDPSDAAEYAQGVDQLLGDVDDLLLTQIWARL